MDSTAVWSVTKANKVLFTSAINLMLAVACFKLLSM